MKLFVRAAALSCVTLLAGSQLLQAQTLTPAVVTSGSIDLAVTGDLHSQLVNAGVVTSYKRYTVSASNTPLFKATGGTLELETGAGEILSDGGVEFVAGANTLLFRDFTIDNTGKTPVVTALVIQNKQHLGRRAIFRSTQGNPFALPLKFGTSTSGPVYFSLDKEISALLTTTFQLTPIPAGTVVGAYTVNVTVFPDPSAIPKCVN